ncbi:hypothetical protein GJAV_G00127000 [Gymnothorax javanicus]|nr:hypothetical protein GJAV_G00127000 [Gymnothorax javanicus]
MSVASGGGGTANARSREVHARLLGSSGPLGRKMIEMSVDKETVLPPDGHAEPRGAAECSGNCAVREAPGAEGDSSGAPSRLEASVERDVVPAGSMSPTNQLCGRSRLDQEEGTGSDLRNIKQTTPSHQRQQQVGLVRQNKRRNTAGSGPKHPGAGKRRRRANSDSDPPVLPSNFLLGGNIFDPLNLNSLLDEEVNRAINAETPESSPLPARSREPVEILVPRDITDPLSLNSDRGVLLSPLQRSSGRRRHRNRHHGGGAGGGEGESEGRRSERTKEIKFKEGAHPRAENDASSCPLVGMQPCPVESECEASIPAQPSLLLPPSLPGVAPDAPREGAASPAPPSSSTPFPRTLTASATVPAITTTVTQQRKCDPPGASSGSSFGKKGRGTTTGVRQGGGAHRKPHPHSQQRPASNHRQQKHKFQYGNYNKYYGYRNPGYSEDPRLRVMKPELFRGKSVLDLGCNSGHLTLYIARNWRPARIVGLDIDGGLVHAARQNVRHFLSDLQALEARRGGARGPGQVEGAETSKVVKKEVGLNQEAEKPERAEEGGRCKSAEAQEEERDEKMREVDGVKENGWRKVGGALQSDEGGAVGGEGGRPETDVDPAAPPAGEAGNDAPFPVSLRISRGPIAAPPLPDTPTAQLGDFPANVSFVRANYVLDSDSLLLSQKAEYDVILCLSISKWVHLNWGDTGLQRFFRRVYKHLNPGGIFILEPQPWSSYGRRRKLTDTIYKNYHSIRLKPDQFCSYLTSEVGFTSYELLGTPKSTSRGFERPIYKFNKGPSCPRK